MAAPARPRTRGSRPVHVARGSNLVAPVRLTRCPRAFVPRALASSQPSRREQDRNDDEDLDWLPTPARSKATPRPQEEARATQEQQSDAEAAGTSAQTNAKDNQSSSLNDWYSASASTSAEWFYAQTTTTASQETQQTDEEFYDDGDSYDDESYANDKPRFQEEDALPWEQTDNATYAGGAYGRNSFDDDEETDTPDVSPLLREELEALLPVSGTGASYSYYWGGVDTILRRLSISLAGLLITTNLNALLAATASLYFVWAPAALSARRNAPLRRFKHAALWHARILSVSREQAPPRRTNTTPPATTTVMLGDGSGARMEVRVPSAGHRKIRGLAVGAPAELVVVSDDASMARFKAVRDIFLPATDEFVCDFPFLERTIMRALSRDVAFERGERQRQEVQSRRRRVRRS